MFDWLNDGVKRVEPTKRMVAGRFGWAIHRFPIKGGKTFKETVLVDARQKLAESIMRPNALLRLLEKHESAH